MSKSQQVFEAMMVAKGYTDLTQVKGRYINPSNYKPAGTTLYLDGN
jgi:hypothetical protein